MMWFLIAFLGYLVAAVVVILDKFILTKSVSRPIVYTFYSTIFLFGVFLAWPLGVELLLGLDWLLAAVSALGFGFGLWVFFIAMKKGEASHITPFVGAVVAISTYILSSYFLRENLSQRQIFGVIVLIFASLLLSFEKTRKSNGFHIGFVWAIGAGILMGISQVSAKYLYDAYGFLTGLVWSKGLVGLVGLFVWFFPAVRKSLRKNREQENKAKTRKTFFLVFAAKVFGILAVVLVQYAAALGRVSQVMALNGLQFVLMFILIYLSTKFAPKLFKEYFTKREIAVEAIAILLVAFGSALFVI